MRARAAVYALLVALAAAGGAVVLTKFTRERMTSPPSTSHDATASVVTMSPPTIVGSLQSQKGIDSSTERRPGDDLPTIAEEPQPAISVDGFLIVTDSRGVEHASEDGSFDPWFFEIVANQDPRSDPPCDRGEAVELRQGRFHVDVPAHRKLGAVNVVAGGRGALVDSAPVDVEAGESITIRAHWPRGVRLRVVDRATNADLDQVEVVQCFGTFQDGQVHSYSLPPQPIVLRCGVSPLMLDSADVPLDLGLYRLPSQRVAGATLRVRARDHAWGTAWIDFESSSERTIELEPAATLVVDVRGDLPGRSDDADETASEDPRLDTERPFLRVREYVAPLAYDEYVEQRIAGFKGIPASNFEGGIKPSLDAVRQHLEEGREEYEARTPQLGELLEEVLARPGRTCFESLKPGECEVSIELGDPGSSLRAGHVTATLLAGRTTRVTLMATEIEWPPPNLRPRVPLAGTLFVGTGWQLERLRLSISPYAPLASMEPDIDSIWLSDMIPIAERPGWYRWSAGSVTPSTYSFSVEAAGFSRMRRIPAGGSEDVEIILPDSATLEVRIVDNRSGAALPLSPPAWIPDLAEGDGWEHLEDYIYFQQDPEGKVYFAHVPVGPGHFFDQFSNLDGWVLDEESARAEIHPGTQELTLLVHRTCGVVLQFTCDGAPVWWENDYGDVLFSTADDQTWACESTTADHVRKYTLEKPGHYYITFERIPGFEAVAPVEVDVTAESFITTTIELKRR